MIQPSRYTLSEAIISMVASDRVDLYKSPAQVFYVEWESFDGAFISIEIRDSEYRFSITPPGKSPGVGFEGGFYNLDELKEEIMAFPPLPVQGFNT